MPPTTHNIYQRPPSLFVPHEDIEAKKALYQFVRRHSPRADEAAPLIEYRAYSMATLRFALREQCHGRQAPCSSAGEMLCWPRIDDAVTSRLGPAEYQPPALCANTAYILRRGARQQALLPRQPPSKMRDMPPRRL